ncbi:MAG: hypothetical protein IPN77_32745 [Sandaracinaceae bacterium]|nr:hypothetical protein [Sandaracinaceae bacterium]
MPARYTTDDGRFQVIRPLIGCDEARIAELAEALAFPHPACNLCGSQEGLQREQMKDLLKGTLEAKRADVRNVMLHDPCAACAPRTCWTVTLPGPGSNGRRARGSRPATPPRPTVQHADAKPRLTVLR